MQGVSQPACWHSSELVFESSRFYQRFPQVDLLSELELKLLGGARINTGAFTHETPVQWLLSRRGVDGGVELVKSGRGRSFGRQPPPPRRQIQVLDAGLKARGRVGKKRQALGAWRL